MRYEIKGGSFPVVICELENGEKMITERGSMAWMSPNVQMETKGGGLGKMFAKAFSGESMFQNHSNARGGAGMIAFASSFPGEITAMEIGTGQEMIVQKSAFLAAEAGVRQGTALAYLIAPPLEGMYAMDAALKAADVKLCKLYAPPSETNFGGGLLSGTQSACEAACTAFAEAVKEVAARPLEG